MVRFPLILALLIGLPALAQTPPAVVDGGDRVQRAQEIYANGTTLYAEGLYEDAIAAFQESYRLSGEHKVLLNVANSYEMLGHFEPAAAVLNRYRAYARPDEQDKLRSRVAANLKRAGTAKALPLPIPPLQAPLPPPPQERKQEEGREASGR